MRPPAECRLVHAWKHRFTRDCDSLALHFMFSKVRPPPPNVFAASLTDARIQDLPPYTELQRAAKFVENFPVPSHLKFPYGDLDRITEPVLPDDLSMPSDERVAQDIVWVEAQHASGESRMPCRCSQRLPIHSHRTDPIWHRTGPMPTY